MYRSIAQELGFPKVLKLAFSCNLSSFQIIDILVSFYAKRRHLPRSRDRFLMGQVPEIKSLEYSYLACLSWASVRLRFKETVCVLLSLHFNGLFVYVNF